MSPPHGTKRPADSALDGEQRLSKRFDLLNLDNTTKAARLYMPVSSARGPPTTTPAPHAQTAKRQRAPRTPTHDDAMLVEDTPHRVYIHDLAAELSDIESDEDNPIFLSDIEAHLSKIPRHVLLGPPPKPTEHNQVVLYNVPASLTVPQEHDNVRKAIVEARQRIRQKQVSGITEPERVLQPAGAEGMRAAQGLGEGTGLAQELGEDADAMELD